MILTSWISVSLALAALVACKKDSGPKAAAQDTFRPASGAENQRKADSLEAPPMFAMIPDYTPLVFANFEPFPTEAWSEMSSAFEPFIDNTFALVEALQSNDFPDDAMLRVLASEL